MAAGMDDIVRPGGRTVVIAHRGASFYHRENSLEAVRAGLEMGADMIEIDVRRTADGFAVVHHDDHFESREIARSDYRSLRRLSVPAGSRIPLLAEVLELCKGRVLLDLELKEPGYEDRILDSAQSVLGPGSFLVSSRHDISLMKVKALHPGVPTGLVLSAERFPLLLRELFPAARARSTDADVLVVDRRLLTLGFLRINRGIRRPVWVFTVNGRRSLWKFITDERIGAVFTDRPDVALFLRELHFLDAGISGGGRERKG